MDPLSALSIAASVVQFTDFATGLLSEAKEVYGSVSGRSQENMDLLQVGEDLIAMTAGIEDRLGASQGATKDVFVRLCHECKDISEALQQALYKIQPVSGHGVQRALSSFSIALKGLWSSSDIQRTKQKLASIRERMMLAALMLLFEQGRSIEESPITYSLEQVDLLQKTNDKDEYTGKFHDEFTNLVQPLGSRHDDYSNDASMHIDRTMTMLWNSDVWTEFVEADTKVKRDADARVVQSVCNSLEFQSFTQREEAIPQAYTETFDWIFQTPRRGDKGETLWSDFPEWLESSSGDMFWITGKPGSGKSTLVKHIVQNAGGRIQTHLEKWSSGLPLLVAGFYFWNAGNQLQKTDTGLMRAILQQCVSQQPNLVVNLFPRRYTILRIIGPHAKLPEWDPDEVFKSFASLLELAGTSFKVALFIDGLDELEEDHPRLVKQLQEANESSAVKICLSSRPWNVFSDAFQRVPSLKLEDLTRQDIETFVQSHFKESPGFMELEAALPSQSAEIVTSIVEKAQGLFLWVHLVVQALLQNLQDGDNISQLQITLDAFPADLEDLYERIWIRIHPKFEADRARYCKMLELARELEEPLSLQYIWLADEETHIKELMGIGNISDESLDNAMKLTTRRLNSRTLMLLDVFPGYRVDYLHRTARDWMKSRWSQVDSKVPEDFDAGLVLLETALDLMSAIPTAKSSLLHLSKYSSDSRVSLLMRLVRIAERAPEVRNLNARLFAAIDKIDTAMGMLDNTLYLHWACSPHGVQDIASRDKNCFVIFCARIGLADYVKWRAEQDSKVLNHYVDDPMHNILGGACVGLVDDPSLPQLSYSSLSDDAKGREDIVIFALGQRRFSRAIRNAIIERGPGHAWCRSLAFKRLHTTDTTDRRKRISGWLKRRLHH